MSCDNFFPVFLLYNDGVLNAFGWAFGMNIQADRFEHPPQATFSVRVTWYTAKISSHLSIFAKSGDSRYFNVDTLHGLLCLSQK